MLPTRSKLPHLTVLNDESVMIVNVIKVIATFYRLLWIRLLFSFIAIWAERDCKSVYSPTCPVCTACC